MFSTSQSYENVQQVSQCKPLTRNLNDNEFLHAHFEHIQILSCAFGC